MVQKANKTNRLRLYEAETKRSYQGDYVDPPEGCYWCLNPGGTGNVRRYGIGTACSGCTNGLLTLTVPKSINISVDFTTYAFSRIAASWATWPNAAAYGLPAIAQTSVASDPGTLVFSMNAPSDIGYTLTHTTSIVTDLDLTSESVFNNDYGWRVREAKWLLLCSYGTVDGPYTLTGTSDGKYIYSMLYLNMAYGVRRTLSGGSYIYNYATPLHGDCGKDSTYLNYGAYGSNMLVVAPPFQIPSTLQSFSSIIAGLGSQFSGNGSGWVTLASSLLPTTCASGHDIDFTDTYNGTLSKPNPGQTTANYIVIHCYDGTPYGTTQPFTVSRTHNLAGTIEVSPN
jgi:hypothetical protein